MDLICLRLSPLPLLLCRDNAALFVAVEGGVPLFHEGESLLSRRDGAFEEVLFVAGGRVVMQI